MIGARPKRRPDADAPRLPTMHLLHLIDTAEMNAGPMRLARIADLIAAMADIRHSVLLIGPADRGDVAASVGLDGAATLTPPLGRIGLAGPALHRRIRHDRADAMVAWSPCVAHLAIGAVPNAGLVVPDPNRLALGFDRLPADPDRRRADLRADWAVDDRTTVVALVGQSSTAIDAMLGGWVVGLVDHTRRSACLLTTPATYGLNRLRRMLRASNRTRQLIVDERAARPWEVLAGADLALSVDSSANFGGVDLRHQPVRRPPTGGGLGLGWAMAAGLAVVAEQADSTRTFITDQQTGLLVQPRRPRRLAWALTRLMDEPAFARRLGRAAAEQARRQFDPAAFAATLVDRLRQASARALAADRLA